MIPLEALGCIRRYALSYAAMQANIRAGSDECPHDRKITMLGGDGKRRVKSYKERSEWQEKL